MAIISFQLLDKTIHDRNRFGCGRKELDTFLKSQANAAIPLGKSRTFVVIDKQQPSEILGYYALVYDRISLVHIPKKKRRGFAEDIPVILLARLAVDIHFQGQGLSRLMVADVLKKACLAHEVAGGAGIVVKAKNLELSWYYHKTFGFIPSKHDPTILFLPIQTVLNTFESESL